MFYCAQMPLPCADARISTTAERSRRPTGVTFFVLLSIFPGIAALVAIYGLFADPSSIGQHQAQQVERVRRIDAEGERHGLLRALLNSSWRSGASPATILPPVLATKKAQRSSLGLESPLLPRRSVTLRSTVSRKGDRAGKLRQPVPKHFQQFAEFLPLSHRRPTPIAVTPLAVAITKCPSYRFPRRSQQARTARVCSE
jgi:hypothetical protein